MEFKANSGLDKLLNLIIPEPFFVHSDLTTGIHYSTSKHHRQLEGITAKNQKFRWKNWKFIACSRRNQIWN